MLDNPLGHLCCKLPYIGGFLLESVDDSLYFFCISAYTSIKCFFQKLRLTRWRAASTFLFPLFIEYAFFKHGEGISETPLARRMIISMASFSHVIDSCVQIFSRSHRMSVSPLFCQIKPDNAGEDGIGDFGYFGGCEEKNSMLAGGSSSVFRRALKAPSRAYGLRRWYRFCIFLVWCKFCMIDDFPDIIDASVAGSIDFNDIYHLMIIKCETVRTIMTRIAVWCYICTVDGFREDTSECRLANTMKTEKIYPWWNVWVLHEFASTFFTKSCPTTSEKFFGR